MNKKEIRQKIHELTQKKIIFVLFFIVGSHTKYQIKNAFQKKIKSLKNSAQRKAPHQKKERVQSQIILSLINYIKMSIRYRTGVHRICQVRSTRQDRWLLRRTNSLMVRTNIIVNINIYVDIDILINISICVGIDIMGILMLMTVFITLIKIMI